jgi:glycosyl transferase family 25
MKPAIKVISLARSHERRAAFATHNAHVAYEFFGAVEGATIRPQMELLPELFGPNLPYTDGAVGCALSHLSLWQDVVDSGRPLTILEDDAILRRDFDSESARVLAGLPPDWDIVVWGWNFDSILALNIMPDVSPTVMHFGQNQLRASIRGFQALEGTPAALRLSECFGTCAYTISPAGARKFMAHCFPLRRFHHFSQGLGRELPNNGIDIPMMGLYPRSRSYCALPPLAVTRNERSNSLVQTAD